MMKFLLFKYFKILIKFILNLSYSLLKIWNYIYSQNYNIINFDTY